MSPRKQLILRSLIEEYVRTATPVASEAIVRKYNLDLSSATVRHELSDLEDAKLIQQPHTSAGRVPTDLGYRYFVEHLMQESNLAYDEQRLIRHQFFQIQNQLDQWVHLTASVMAQLLQNTAIMPLPRATEARLKHFEILSITDTSALLVLVLTDASVRQQRLSFDEPLNQEKLSREAEVLNALFTEKSAEELKTLLASATFAEIGKLIAQALLSMLEEHCSALNNAFYHDGILRMLEQPEYSRLGQESERSDRVRKVIEVLEQNRFLPSLTSQLQNSDGVQVIIGGENEWDAMKDVSLIIARYGKEGSVGGLLGIVGPTRMQYGRAIAVVKYMAQVMNELLFEAYGSTL
jgi:heat-inducible transcriptional repressor